MNDSSNTNNSVTSAENTAPTVDKDLRAKAWRDIVLYGVARLGLFIVLTIVIQGAAVLIDAPVPLPLSALFALLIAFPLSMFVFSGLRTRVTRELADTNAQRKAHKEWVKKQIADR